MNTYCAIFLVAATLVQPDPTTGAPECDTIVQRLEEKVNELKSCKCKPKEFGCCEEVFEKYPDAEDGYYTIVNEEGETKKVYCVKTIPKCGEEVVGWTRVAYVDMTVEKECPNGMFTTDMHGHMYCERDNCGGGNSNCIISSFTANTVYNKVCGRIRGYQYDGTGRVEGIYDNTGGIDSIIPNDNIDGAYVDGVSITYDTPHKHIFTLIAGQREDSSGRVDCPCNTGSTETLPSFVGEDYYCESGVSGEGTANTVYTEDPLWDGELCRHAEVNCCTNSRMPYFRKDLEENTDENVDVRICSSEGYPDEGTPIDLIELYVN